MRLIDADVMVAEMEKQITKRDKIMELCKRAGDMENYFRCSNNQTEIVSFVRMLNNAPTIVPAEGVNQPSFQRKEGTLMAEWISVKERLPEDGKYVLAYSADDDFMTVEARHHFGVFQITHWMQLPEPPKEVNDGN